MNSGFSKLFHYSLLLGMFLTQTTFASYRLENFPAFESCPFMHDDPYSAEIGRLHNVIEGFLQAKIQGNQECLGPFNVVSQNLNQINDLFNNTKNPALFEEISDEILSKQLLQLELDLISTTSGSTEYLQIASEIRRLENAIYTNDINTSFSRDYFRETRDNRALAQTFDHMNNVVNTLAYMPSQCVGLLGGWQSVVPTILNSVSSLSGLSGMAYSAVIGSGLKLISSLTILLQDIEVKAALKDLVRHKNSKILACTYYSVQNTACEYRRALRLSEDERRIRNIIEQKYEHADTKIFDMYFKLLEHSTDFEKVFYDIASMGSAVSLDTELLNKYFKAKRSSPEAILNPEDIGPPPSEDDDSSDADRRRQEWLLRVKERGINFEDRNFLGPKPLKDQIKEALLDISLKISDIQGVEFVLGGRRSFVDLKHELDTDPELIKKTKKFIKFFKKIIAQEIVSTDKKGLIAEGLRIMIELKNFLAIQYQSSPENIFSLESEGDIITDYQSYISRVNDQGKNLFEAMAEGAVAQISKQTVLTVGKTVQERISRVFRLLEEEFLRDELRQHRNLSDSEHTSEKIKYSEYKRDWSLLIRLATSYQMFSGSGKTFRSEDIDVAVKALEKGFMKEIKSMLKKSLQLKSDYYENLNGETSAHLCALFSMSLKRKGFFRHSAKKLFKTCRSRFQKLELMKIVEPSEMTINWDDPCFYYDYRRLLSTQESLYRKMLKLGFEVSDKEAIAPYLIRNGSGL